MKKVTLIAVGRLKESFFKDAAAEYIKRLQRFCELKIVEIGDLSGADAVKKESNLILDAVGARPFWLCDSSGESYTSVELAACLDKAFLGGEVAFVIGGSGGVDSNVRRKAEKLVSFSRLTYPHQLFRVMFLEQLYRAFTITAKMPYNK